MHTDDSAGGMCCGTAGAAVPEAGAHGSLQPQDMHHVQQGTRHATGAHPHTQVGVWLGQFPAAVT